MPVVLEALAKREPDRQRLRYALADATNGAGLAVTPGALKAQLRAFLADWMALVNGKVAEARNLLGIAMADRIGFEPSETGSYALRVPIAFDRVITAAVPELRGLQDCLASPEGFEPSLPA